MNSKTGCLSGREDSNLRPRGPEPRALARLSHAPLLKLVNLRGNLIYKIIYSRFSRIPQNAPPHCDPIRWRQSLTSGHLVPNQFSGVVEVVLLQLQTIYICFRCIALTKVAMTGKSSRIINSPPTGSNPIRSTFIPGSAQCRDQTDSPALSRCVSLRSQELVRASSAYRRKSCR